MKRTDNLPENALVKRITDLRQQLDTLKTAQRSGSASVIVSRNVTGNPVDITTTLTYNSPQIWEITFTPAVAPFTNSGFVWRLFVDVVSYTGSLTFDQFIEVIPAASSTQTYRLYMMGRASGSSTILNLLVVIYSIGAGSIGIARIL